MTQKHSSDAYPGRASIDAGFSFALAAFVLGLGLLAFLARVGLPDTRSALLRLGDDLRRPRRSSQRGCARCGRREFYAGGRNLPPAYTALAYAGLAAGLFLPFLPPLLPDVSFSSLAVGFALGSAAALCVTGPYLRRSAAFSIADLVGMRFPHPLVRCAIAGIAAGCAVFVALAGYDIALRAFIATTGIEPQPRHLRRRLPAHSVDRARRPLRRHLACGRRDDRELGRARPAGGARSAASNRRLAFGMTRFAQLARHGTCAGLRSRNRRRIGARTCSLDAAVRPVSRERRTHYGATGRTAGGVFHRRAGASFNHQPVARLLCAR